MQPFTKQVKLSEVRFDEKVYPRKGHDPALVQKYADCLDEIEARGNWMSIAEDGTLLDGRHRHLAYQKLADGNDPLVTVFCYDVVEEADKFRVAVELNASHGAQLSESDKRADALRLYGSYQIPIDEIARILGVRKQAVSDWTKGIREERERKENETIYDMWLACATYEEIGAAIGKAKSVVSDRISSFCSEKFPGTKSYKVAKFDDDDEWAPPLYNIWSYAAKTNSVKHFGNSEQRILDNLLYLYTKPFDIVLDPFAGGGATIDVCKRRARRYWVSDRKPIIERAHEIRTLDLTQDLPSLAWSEVTLSYLDPPYWKQAEGKYSNDPTDFANMSLDEFTDRLAGVVRRIAQKQTRGVIAMLMQPTQWNAPDHQYTDHVVDLIRAVGNKTLTVEYRVSCPYATEQWNAQQVEWAKANKKLLVLTRELVVWRING